VYYHAVLRQDLSTPDPTTDASTSEFNPDEVSIPVFNQQAEYQIIDSLALEGV
jgi:hypothetical protein